MKYLILVVLVTSCALPQRNSKKPRLIMKSDKIEKCIKELIGSFDVKPTEASAICIEIRK